VFTGRRTNFTDRVRNLLAFARDTARRRGDPEVLPGHLLLGVLEDGLGDDGGGVAFAVLQNRGVPIDELRRDAEALLPPSGSPHPEAQDVPYSPVTKSMLVGSMAEARELEHRYVGTEHLLLALLRDQRNPVAELLSGRGLDHEGATAMILQLLGVPPGAR
jgi:ATP-dependent Clp protease ATP-binding subunit ClpC